MTEAPLISVIVPIYNSEKTLQSCIDSVLTQSFDDFELLLINDGSKDNSQSICEVYDKAKANVKLISVPNRGAYAARALGLKHASGRYVTFLDSDDTFKDNVFSEIAGRLDDKVDILVTACEENCNISRLTFQKDIVSNRINAALHGRFFRSDVLRKGLIEIHRDIVIGEDMLLNLRASLWATHIEYSQLIIYNYNLNTSSITQNFNRSWLYERKFHLLIRESFLNQLVNVDEELKVFCYVSFLKGCKLALLNKSKIDYDDIVWKEMKCVLSKHRDLLWWDEKLTLDIPSSLLCRILIRILYKFI